MRIVAGRHKGRPLSAPAGQIARPTSDRAREALFSMLAARGAIAEAQVIDVFAGTGALGLEALSRGAASACFVESHSASIAALRENIRKLDEGARTRVIRTEAAKLPQAETPCSLAFLDAPYDKGLTRPALEALAARNWLAPDSLVVIEIGAREELLLPPAFSEEDRRVYGAAQIILSRYRA